MSANINLNYTVTTNGEDVAKDQAKTVDRINQQMLTTLRRTAQVGMALTQTFGGVIDQTYGLAIEAALLAIETAVTTDSALVLSGNPAAIALVTARAAAVGSIIALILKIETGRTQGLQQTQSAVSLFRMLTFR